MELLTLEQVKNIASNYGRNKVLNYEIKKLNEKLVGYLGDHLKFTVIVENEEGTRNELKLFIKCIPIDNEWMADYIRRLNFFKKEYIMLSQLFKEFRDDGPKKWRPKLLFIQDELFVFEDVTALGYTMPDHLKTLSYAETISVVEALARFHAQSYIYEEKQSALLDRPYRIWEEYSEFLQEPTKGQNWRNAGRDAAIDLLKVFSSHKNMTKFEEKVTEGIHKLYERAWVLMKPWPNFRNAVIHRDLWTNNIFIKKTKDSSLHAMLIDFQTVLYASPMMDLTSFIYFNSSRSFRDVYTNKIFDIYYKSMSEELNNHGVDINTLFTKAELKESYEESIVFGISQAAIIVPIIALVDEDRDRIFANPETCHKVNEVSRSVELISVAKEDAVYRQRVIEILDEIIERYCFSNSHIDLNFNLL